MTIKSEKKVSENESNFEDIDLIRAFRFLIRNWLFIVICTAVSAGSMSVYLMRAPRLFTSTGTFFVLSEGGGSGARGGLYASILGVSIPADISNYVGPLFKSQRLKMRVSNILHVDFKKNMPSLELDEKTRIFKISFTHHDPKFSQLVLQTYLNELNKLNLELELSPKKELFTILDAPSLPKKPSSPNIPKNIILSIIGGIFMGILLPFLGIFWRILHAKD